MAAPPPSEGGGFHYSVNDFPVLSKGDKEGNENMPLPTKPKYAEKVRPPPHIPFNALPPFPDVVIKPPLVTTKDGLRAIVFAKEELEASATALKHCLIASFYGVRPSVNVFDKHVNTEWGLNKTAVVGLMNPRQFLIRFQEENDYIRAWSRHVSTFQGSRFQLFKWTPNFDACKQKWKAVWLELPYLPIELQLPSFLENIGNCIGNFLSMDERTRSGKHPIAPRICVELNVSQTLQKTIWIGSDLDDESIGFWQPIAYDFTRSICTICRRTGHETIECTRGQPSASVAGQIQRHFKKPSMLQPTKQLWVEKVSQTKWKNIEDHVFNTPNTHIPEICTAIVPFASFFKPNKLTFQHNPPQYELSMSPGEIKLANNNQGENIHFECATPLPLSILAPKLTPPMVPPIFYDQNGQYSVESAFVPQPSHVFIRPLVSKLSQEPNDPMKSNGEPNDKDSTHLPNNVYTLSSIVHNLNLNTTNNHSADLQTKCQAMQNEGFMLKNDLTGGNSNLIEGKDIICNGNTMETSIVYYKNVGDNLLHSNQLLDVPHAAPNSLQLVVHNSHFSNSFADSMDNAHQISKSKSHLDPNAIVEDHLFEHKKLLEVPNPPQDSLEATTQNLHISCEENEGFIQMEDLTRINSNFEEGILSSDELPSRIKILRDGSKEQAEMMEALTSEPTNPTDQEVTLRTLRGKSKHAIRPSLLDSVRKAAKRHTKVSAKAIRVEWNSIGQMESGTKWADVIDSEEEQ